MPVTRERWRAGRPAGGVDLLDAVRHVEPTVLLGTSTVHGAFTREVIETMSAAVERPIVFPISNPTSRIEAMPADVIAWSNGKALVAVGIPVAAGRVRGRDLPDRAGQQRAASIRASASARSCPARRGLPRACCSRRPRRSPARSTSPRRVRRWCPPVEQPARLERDHRGRRRRGRRRGRRCHGQGRRLGASRSRTRCGRGLSSRHGRPLAASRLNFWPAALARSPAQSERPGGIGDRYPGDLSWPARPACSRRAARSPPRRG